MPQLAANLSTLFGEWPFRERFAAAAAAGFRFVEYHFPYVEGSAAEVAAWIRGAGVAVALHNLPPGDIARGERGIACLPARVDEFRDDVGRAIEYAQAAGAPCLNCLAGVAPPSSDRALLFETLVSNLRYAAAQTAAANISLLIEPLNLRTAPGYLLATSAAALEVIRAVGSGNLRLQYDLFHMQISEGDLYTRMRGLLPHIGHIQVAGVPDRTEPDVGEVNVQWLLGQLDAMGYQGRVGCEYTPRAGTLAGLEWARPWLKPQAEQHS